MDRESIYDRLIQAQQNWSRASSDAARYKTERDSEIRWLNKEGVPAARIAEVLGISRQAVTKIINEDRPKKD